MSAPHSSKLTRNYRLILVGILLVAAVLRLYGLNNLSPPGLEHDEVAHWIINRDILAGNHGIYFAEAYGHEAGFHYVQTGFMVLMGDNPLVLRLPSAFAGLLLVAVSFALARRLFGLRAALLAAAIIAVLFWPVFYSRLALRAIALPLLSGLSAYFWWRGWRPLPRDKAHDPGSISGDGGQPGWFALAGLLAGLALYTYMAARAVPIFYTLFALYLLVFHRPVFWQRKRGILLFFGVLTLVAAPLVVFLLSNSGVEYRIGEIDAPLRALAQGDLRPVIENTLKIMAMFAWQGDPLWRQNVAHLPVFDLIVALFFTIGLLISLWRWRQARYAFLILWLFTSTIPSIVTIDAPSSIRIINALPVLGIFPVIGLQVIHLFRRLSTVSGKLSPVFARNLAIVCIMLLFIWNIGRTWRAIFHTWPANDEVQFVWQQALTDTARYLDASQEGGPVAVGGWTPDTMDPPTMELTLKREDLSLRYFDPSRAIIASPSGRIVLPADLPLHASLATALSARGVHPEPMGSFTIYRAGDAFSDELLAPALETFGNEISLLGYEIGGDPDAFELTTFWRVEEPSSANRRIFLHLLDESGDIVAQDDALGAPAAHWQEGDIIIQRHTTTVPAINETLQVRIGLYDPGSGVRLMTTGGADFVTIVSARVQ